MGRATFEQCDHDTYYASVYDPQSGDPSTIMSLDLDLDLDLGTSRTSNLVLSSTTKWRLAS